MHYFRSADSFWYRAALYLAFAAIYLLFAGPLLSQWQAQASSLDHASEHSSKHALEHLSEHSPAHAHGHDGTDLCETPAPSSHANNPLHHWYHQCDYCGIWQNTPTAPHHLPAIGSVAFITRTPLPTAFTQHAAAVQAYPHAYPRAPPSLNVI